MADAVEQGVELGQRWQQLLALLRAQPAANLNAMDDRGLFVPLPPALLALGQPALIGRSGIESVEPEDHGPAIEAWLSALEHGHGSAEVLDRSHPLHLTRVEFFDLRAAYGVLVAVAYRTGLRQRRPVPETPEPVEPPRVGRLRKDIHAVIVATDPAVEQMLGCPPGGLVGMRARDLVHPDDQALATSAWIGLLARPGSDDRVRLRHRRADSSWLWVDVVNHNLLHDPAYGCVLADVVDVSREMAFREDVRARELLLRRLTQALPVGVVQVSAAGQVLYSNERFHQVLGVPAWPDLVGQLASLRPGDRDRLLGALETALRTGADSDLQVELDVEVDDGSRRVLDVALRPLLDPDGVPEGCLACVSDVTEAVLLRAELEQRATHDVLTGCLNRGALLRCLEEKLRAVRPGSGCAVLFLDLDGFKRINDTRGHAAGDDVLRQVAAVLRSAARAGDAVGRLGGDEFVLVCPAVGSAEQALALGVDVQARVRRSHASVLAGASTGVAYADDPTLAAETVLGRADAAMYAAKQDRRASAALWPVAPRPIATGPATTGPATAPTGTARAR